MQAVDCVKLVLCALLCCCVVKKQSVKKVLSTKQTSHRVEAELQVSSDDFVLSSAVHLYNESDVLPVQQLYNTILCEHLELLENKGCVGRFYREGSC